MSGVVKVCVTTQTYEEDLASTGRVVGNIYPAARGGTAHRNVIIPCGPSAEPAEYTVEAGSYLVSATLPSGAELAEDIDIRDGEEVVVRLDASDSPFESHSWQYILGNIESNAVYRDAASVPIPRSYGSRFAAAEEVPVLALPDGDWAAPIPTSPVVTALWTDQAPAQSWSFEATLALVNSRPDIQHAAQAFAQTAMVPVLPAQTDGTSHIYRFDYNGPLGGGMAIHHGDRQFLMVEIAGVSHLVTVPGRWGNAQAEVLVNARQSPTGSPISVAVRDPALGASLAYMSRGAFDAAASLVADAEEMLFMKLSNPLAAAAGAYILIGSEGGADEPHRWDPWLDNLRQWFPWMSDGAILWAVRHSRRAQSEEDISATRTALVEAFDRGIPHYTVGLSWLIDGLSEFPDDPDCQERLRLARRLSWAVDMREPFLVVRLASGARP